MLAFGGDLFGGCMQVLHVMVVGGGGEEATPGSAHPHRQQPRKPPLGLVVVGTSSRSQLSPTTSKGRWNPQKQGLLTPVFEKKHPVLQDF